MKILGQIGLNGPTASIRRLMYTRLDRKTFVEIT